MSRIVSRYLVIPGYEAGLKRRKSFRYWSTLERSQWLSRAELQSQQSAALRALLSHAFQNSDFSAEKWGELGLDPKSVAGVDDLQRWPLLRREDIRQHLDQVRCRWNGDAIMSKATGGSSGVPLQFYLNQDSDDRRMAAWHRGYSWAGAAPGTKQVYLWGVALGQRTARQRLKDLVYNKWIYRRHVLNTFELCDATMADYLASYNRYRPDVLVAYTNPLYAFASWLEEHSQRPFSPKSIVVGAEKLHDFQRERIERVFQAPVFETYGSREFMLIGAECDRHAGLHLTSEHLIVEVVDDEGRPTPAGEEGQVVVTDLYNYALPFVRYVTGDRAVAGFEPCRCGRGLPMLRKVVGRQLDILTTPSGRQIPGEFFPHLVKDFSAVRRFQVVQSRPDQIALKLVVTDEWSAESRERLRQLIQRQLGDDVELVVREVDDIPLTGAGKLRVVVNEWAGAKVPVAAASV